MSGEVYTRREDLSQVRAVYLRREDLSQYRQHHPSARQLSTAMSLSVMCEVQPLPLPGLLST